MMMMNNYHIRTNQATTNNNDELGIHIFYTSYMSSFFSDFEETDALFLEFEDTFNNVSSSLDDTSSIIFFIWVIGYI